MVAFWWFPTALVLFDLALAKPWLWRLAWRVRRPAWLEATRLTAIASAF
jgi:hypothetical protein